MQRVDINSVEEQIYEKRKTVRYDVRDLTVETKANKYDDSLELDDDMSGRFNYIYVPEYQRDFTWDITRQSKLIESIILGLPIPFIFIAENKNSAWEIVDGSQRIRTIHSFIKNNLRLENLEELSTLNGYLFSELDVTRQGKILNTALRIIVLSEETTDDIKKDMFERINRGSDLLKPMEKRKGILQGEFTNFLYSYCEKATLFKQLALIDKWLVNRQEYEELLLRFFAISDKSAYESGIQTGISVFLDNYLSEMNKKLSSMSQNDKKNLLYEYEDRINKVCEYVNKNFPYGFRHKYNPQTKRSVFEAISIGVWLAIKNNVIKNPLDKENVEKSLSLDKFRQCTHIAYKLHEKQKLNGRISFIYELVSGHSLI